MAYINIKVSDKEKKLFEEYVLLADKNLNTFIKDCLYEKIEDEYDY